MSLRSLPKIWLFIHLLPALSFGQANDANHLLTRGEKHIYNGYYDSAINVLQKALVSFNIDLDVDDIITTYYVLGDGYLNLGKCDSAEYVINQGLSLSGDRQALLAEGYYMRAKSVSGCSNRWEEAKKDLFKSLLIKEALYGAESIAVSFDYNLMGYIYHFSAEYDSAEYYLDRALSIRSGNPEIDSVEISATYFYLGKVNQKKDRLKQALEYSLLALDIRQRLLPLNHPSTSNSLDDVGRIYKSFGNNDRALDYYQHGLEIRKKTLGDDHVNVGASYYSIGTLHGNMFNYRRAIHFIEQGNLILKNKYGEKIPVLHTYYAYLGQMYHKVGELKKAQELLSLSLSLSEKYLPEDHLYLAIIYNIIGQYHSDRNELDLQQTYHLKALNIYRARGIRTVNEADVLSELGKASLMTKDFSRAKKYFDESISIYKDHFGDKGSKMATLYQHKGNLKRQQGDLLAALNDYWMSLESLSFDSIEKDAVFDLKLLTHKQKALTSIHRIANTYRTLYNESKNVEDFKRSLQFFEKGISLIDLIGSEYQLEDSRTQLANDTRSFFNDAINATYEFYELTGEDEYKNNLFYIIEKSKSPVLLSRIQETEARQFSGVPDSLISKEIDFRVELSYYKDQLRNLRATNNENKVSFYQKEVFETQNAYERFKEELKSKFSNYYAYRYASDIIDISELRKSLPPETMMLEYYQGESEIYVLSISDQVFDIRQINISDTLTLSMYDYQKSLTDNVFIVNEPKVADSLLVTSAYRLCQILVSPNVQSAQNIQKLLIIPDGDLSELNFGTFLTKPAESGKIAYDLLTYLLSEYSISYAYSATLNFRKTTTTANLGFAGFAPSYEASLYTSIDSSQHPMTYELVREGRLPLPGAIEEVRKISIFFGGKIWINEEASESNFKSNAGKYSVLHLAMHSLLNGEEPEYSELLFNHQNDSLNDGYLTIDEIYNLDLDAAMVVLSACSSGGGALEVGEGPISFTRAFSYAGCPSVIMSMWKLPDASTNQIMVEFYHNIRSGDTKDVALRKAQLKYLESMDDPLYQHPFFWGSFVALGDTDPIASANNWSGKRMLFYAIGFLVILGFVFRKKFFTLGH
ncbi:CHAT domain-containing protein [Ekhidna sp.]